jgi:hypothetical protein
MPATPLLGSLSMLIAVVRCPVSKGRNITYYTMDNDEDKKAWLTNLLGSLITLLQADRDLKLEDLRPSTVIHEGCTGEECFAGTSHASPGRNLVTDEFEHFSEPETTMMDQDDVLIIFFFSALRVLDYLQ